ncbi:VanZ family protein [Jutongia sp.]
MSVYQCMLADISDVAAFLPKAVLLGILVGIVLWLCHVRGRQWIGSVLFVIYAVVLLQTVFFCREQGSRWGTDMRLFGTWGTTMQDHAWVLENVLLFIPFGLLLPLLLPKRWHPVTVPAGLLSSICIEYVQLRTGRGFCQLDDVVMNTLGALAGYLLWLAGRGLLRGMRCFCSRQGRRRGLFGVLVLLWMLVIFSFSAQPADESTQTSLRVGRAVCAVIVPDYAQMTQEQQTAWAERIEFPVRKGAHMTEYAVLAVLWLGVLAGEEITRKRALIAIALTALYASTDEFHQLFVPGRSGQVRDVLIDSCGAAIGVLIVWGIIKFYSSKKEKQ